MNVWIRDSTLKAACGNISVNRSLCSSSISNETPGSARHGAWEWVEAIVISGSYSSGATPGGNVLTVKVTDSHSQYHHVERIEISSRHLVGPGRSVLPANSFNDECDLPTDLTQLTHLHEPAVVDCLKRRCKLAGWKMYSHSGPILIAINPCKNVPGLYDSNAMKLYWNYGEHLACGGAQEDAPPPHVFGVADSAYRNMLRGLDYVRSSAEKADQAVNHDILPNQSILVSGESGAGKTVSCFHLMKYLATLSTKVDPEISKRRDASASSIEQRVLQSNAILEAFGCARTLRNDNSSRFGKFIELKFSNRGQLLGAFIDTYLLEKARIVSHTCGERTYHIFYEVLDEKSFSSGEREKLCINSATSRDFAITAPEGGGERSRLLHNGYEDHAKMFAELKRSMHTMDFSRHDQMEIFQTVIGLLHLSNLTLQGGLIETKDGEGCTINIGHPSLGPALRLLGVSCEAMNTAVTTVQFKAVNELVTRNLNVDQSCRAIQALIKGAYDSIFMLLVARINSCIVGTEDDSGGAFIGLLDIFGFECFTSNSFEQLCINYCNESLQQQFNRFVFKLEQEEYTREGIKWDMIEFQDNQDILDLIDMKNGGILTILDEQGKLGMRCNDRTFASAIYTKCQGTSERFGADKKQQSRGLFSINHYAGLVEYDTAGFMAKNKDEIPMEAATLLASSSCAFIRSIAEAISAKENGGSAAKSSISRVSVGGQFSNQLRRLRRRIDGTHPHYVRCLKPNDQLQPCNFDPNTVVDQLRCGGIIEAIRVSRAGFPHRYTFEHFSSRFGIIGNVLGNKKRQGPKRAVGKLNFGKSATAANSRKCARGLSANPKKSSEILVRNIARWILAERERQKQDESPDLQQGTETSARSEAMSPRSFWKNQSPHSGDYDPQHKQPANSEAGIQLGTTKVFLLQDTFDCIERLRGQVLSDSATRLAAVGRMYIARRSYLNILRAYYEARVHQGLETLSPPSIAENRSDDSALRNIDVNIGRFECVSEDVGQRVPVPIEFEWVPSGFGRYVRKSEDDTDDADVEACMPPENDNACHDVYNQLVAPPQEGDGSATASVVSLARQRYQQAISPRKASNSVLGMKLKQPKPESPKSSLTRVNIESEETLAMPASRDKRAVEGEENSLDRLYRQKMQQKASTATPTIVRRQFSVPIEPITTVNSRQGTSFASSGTQGARVVLLRQQSEPHFGAKGANPANYQHFSVPGKRCEVARQSPHKVETPPNIRQLKLDRDPSSKQIEAHIRSHPKPFDQHRRQISALQPSPSVLTDRCRDGSEVNQETGKLKRISPRSKRRSHRHVARFKQAQHRHQDSSQDSDLVDL
mmetsp:Transcript_12632/g.28976  ORF Transcript_12632/g.28976 Transcript_12632/m.28976 type:complete len:1330 (+) Transcript_12632:110-4099(+)